MHHRIPYWRGVLICGLALATLTGCSSTVQYIIRQGIGQISMTVCSVEIDEVLARQMLDQEHERKLRLVVAARDFARTQLDLRVGSSFRYFHETNGEPVAYNLSASRRDELVPKYWRFPIVGSLAYIGFFARDDADAEAAKLQEQGYDTYIYGVDAYSTLGWFPDPVQSKLLDRSDGSLVDTVIHELAHNTVYSVYDSNYNESLAMYIGRKGARLFYEQQGTSGQEILAGLEAGYADQEIITTWMMPFETELRAHYAQNITSDDKIAGREAVFQAARERFINEVQPQLSNPPSYDWWGRIPTNNAFVLLHRRYNYDLDLFASAYEYVNGDFEAFIELLRAAANNEKPFDHLRAAVNSP
ncbi:MAG: aminopeptidase [Planctomycetota bacterium]